MNVSRFIVESAAFTRATLWERPSRWLIFILLGLPWMALSSLVESSKILEGSTLHWNLIPWQEAGLLIGAGLLCNFLISGWVVRLLRNDPVPPDFDHPFLLCLNGMKVHVIPLVWMLVPSVLAFVQYSLVSSGIISGSWWELNPGTILFLVLLALQIIILFIAVQYAMIGAIRFARTGSVREGFALLEIKKTMDRIGIVNYYLGLGVIVLVWMLFSLSLRGIALLPSAGPVLSLGLSPVPTVFCFRFIAHFCDEERLEGGQGEGEAVTVRAPVSRAVPALMAEFLVWLFILAVLVVLCFTPMVLVFGSVSRFFP
jgi:hypothetical protein